jgi:hypothetical protein
MSKFRDANNRMRTESLFKEHSTPELVASGYTPQWTLKQEHEPEGLPSLHRLYVEAADLTEYQFALDTLGSWEHWLRLKRAPFFKDAYAAMREELETKIESVGFLNLKAMAAGKGPIAAQASKWLAERGWERKARGRPSKQEIAKAAREMSQDAASTRSDAQRLGLKVVK